MSPFLGNRRLIATMGEQQGALRADMADKPVEELDITRMNLNWGNLKLWFLQHWEAVIWAAVVGGMVWGTAVLIGHPYTHAVVPTGAKVVVISPVQTYEMYEQGNVLTLTRYRGGFVPAFLWFFTYLLAFFPIHSLIVYRRTKHGKTHHHHHQGAVRRRFSIWPLVSYGFLSLVFIGLFYAWGYQTWWVVTHPRVFVFDPEQDSVSLNGEQFMKMRDVAHFYGVEHPGRRRVGEWGVVLSDGTKIPFDYDLWVGDVTTNTDIAKALVTYLNEYLDHDVLNNRGQTERSRIKRTPS